jgi:hypothetical protein
VARRCWCVRQAMSRRRRQAARVRTLRPFHVNQFPSGTDSQTGAADPPRASGSSRAGEDHLGHLQLEAERSEPLWATRPIPAEADRGCPPGLIRGLVLGTIATGSAQRSRQVRRERRALQRLAGPAVVHLGGHSRRLRRWSRRGLDPEPAQPATAREDAAEQDRSGRLSAGSRTCRSQDLPDEVATAD